MFGAIRRLIQSGDIRGLLDASRKIFRQFGIEIEVAKGRRELSGGKAPYGGYRTNAFGASIIDESPFSYWIARLNQEDYYRLENDFWGDLPWNSRDEAIRNFVEDSKRPPKTNEQLWNDYFTQSLQWGDWRNSKFFNPRYNPRTGFRAGADWNEPLYWKLSGEPIKADGIEILPWDRYDAQEPIEMTRYTDPFFNSPIVKPRPIIDINRNRMW